MTTTASIAPLHTARTPAPAAAVQARQLLRHFGAAPVLDGLDLDLAPGEFVALLGRSGCGKSTLLRALAGLDRIDGGSLQVPDARSAVFQEPRLMPWKRAWRNVLLGLESGRDGRGQAAGRERARAALAEVGLAHREDAWPATLSGGEAQRVALARALVREPALLLLDEPFAALDALTRIRMHRLVLDLWQRHRPAVLLVTHDVDEAIALTDRVLVLDGGRIVADHAIALPRAQRSDQPALRQLRRTLLSQLGVDGPSAAADDGAGDTAAPSATRAPVYDFLASSRERATRAWPLRISA